MEIKQQNKDKSENAEKNNNLIANSIKEYFDGPYIDENNTMHDISYTKWVEQDTNIKKLCSSFEVILEEKSTNNNNHDPFGILTKHDYGCELKLIKWITEDETHRNNFIKIGNNGAKINRHNDILPYEFNAVPLDLNVNEKNLDNYINASYIDGPCKSESKLFIATQGPLKETIPSFWKMIFNHKITLVIMLSSGLEEAEGRNVVYWPDNKENPLFINSYNINIEFISQEEIIPNALILKKFKINNELEVKQIHVICWPDHGLPNDNNLANNLVEKMIEYIQEARRGEKKSPVVVHCSAGVGRTGTLIAIYIIVICLQKLKELNKPFIMNVFNVVRKLREQRYSLVTDKDQYKFIYDYSLYWIKKNGFA